MGRFLSSELYRAKKSKGLMVFMGILIFIIMAAILFIRVNIDDKVFEFKNVTSILVMFLLSGHYGILIIMAIMMSGEMKEGCLKNSISSGVDRKAIVLGKTIAYTLISLLAFIVLITVIVGMSILLSGGNLNLDTEWKEVFKSIIMMLVNGIPLWVADMSIFLFLYIVIKNSSTAGITAALFAAGVPASIMQLAITKSTGVLQEVLIYIFNHIPSIMNMKQLQNATDKVLFSGEIYMTGIIYIVVVTTLSIIFMEKREY